MRLTVLGGCGAWPGPGQACSGYLLEHDGFRLLPDVRVISPARGTLRARLGWPARNVFC
jgi:hypothetical protein